MKKNASKDGSSMLPAWFVQGCWDKDQCPAGHVDLPHPGFIPQLRASPCLVLDIFIFSN